jgi:hypothetical protein
VEDGMNLLRRGSIAVAFMAAACTISADTTLAERAVDAFHEMLNAGQFDAIYAASADDMKKAARREEFVALLEAVHRKLGVTKSWSKKGWNVSYNTSGTFMTLAYSTIYDGGDAAEQFVYRLADGKALLAGYHINSAALILK